MRKIYSCIDIGSHSLKLVVMEKVGDDFVVLSRSIVKSKGIKKGEIVDIEQAIISIKKLIEKVEEDLKVKIKELLCLIPSEKADFEMVVASIETDKEITGKTVEKVLNNAVLKNEDESRFVLSAIPVSYKIDDGDNIKEVKGLTGNVLTSKVVLATIPKVVVASYVELFKQLNIKLIDVGFGIVGDYYNTKCKELDSTATAVINIGYDKCDVGIFNKGILIKSAKIDMGSRYVDKDIKYVYNVDTKTARYLKETFACSNTRYADVDDVVTIKDKDDNQIVINQLKISEVVEARISEILKFAKKQISILTKREIRYIIVTGGISELAGFEYVLENVFGRCARVLNMNKMGVRSNSFSSCVGFIEYFDEKLERLDKAYSMISDTELDLITKRTRKTSGESAIGGIIGYFTGNKED